MLEKIDIKLPLDKALMISTNTYGKDVIKWV